MASYEARGKRVRAVVRLTGGGKATQTFGTMADAVVWGEAQESLKRAEQPNRSGRPAATSRTLSGAIEAPEAAAAVMLDAAAGVDAALLARELAAIMDPERLLDAAEVGALVGCEARYVSEQYAPTPGFPKAIRLTGPGGRRGQPRWLRGDIVAWVAAHKGGKSKRGGRPRNTD